MDTCSAVSAKITAVLTECYEGVDNKEFDAITVKESLSQLPQREDTWSIYGSRARKDRSIHLASKLAQLNWDRERDHSSEKLKILEDQKDLEIMEAEYNAYIEVESR